MASSSLPHPGLRKLPPFWFYTGMRKLPSFWFYTGMRKLPSFWFYTGMRKLPSFWFYTGMRKLPPFWFYTGMRKRGGRKLYISTCFIQSASDTRLSHATRVITLCQPVFICTTIFASAVLITIEQTKHIQQLLPTYTAVATNSKGGTFLCSMHVRVKT